MEQPKDKQQEEASPQQPSTVEIKTMLNLSHLKVETEYEHEGVSVKRDQYELIGELIEKHNALVDYLAEGAIK